MIGAGAGAGAGGDTAELRKDSGGGSRRWHWENGCVRKMKNHGEKEGLWGEI